MHEGNSIMSTLRNMDAQILLGNHEAMLLGELPCDEKKEQIYGLKEDLKGISHDNLAYIKTLSPQMHQIYNGKNILFVHGNPDNPLNGYLYENDEKYDWKQFEYDFVFMGHTHYPYIKQVGSTTYINVGSCGLPRDQGNAPSFVIYDTKSCMVTIHRVLICEKEIEMIAKDHVHHKVLECLMREGERV